MIKKPFKDIELSRLGMGNMRLPMKDASNDLIDYEKAHEIIDYAYNNGINYFDTAYVYNKGDSEKCVGSCMEKYDRDSFYIATKYNIGAEKDYKKAFETQLERLHTDHIDFYLIHCVLDFNADEYINSGAIEYFMQKKAEGKITYLGFSSHASVATLERFADLQKWDFAQIQLNYYDWLFGSAKKEYEALYSRNIPIMVMEPVRGGRLAKLTPDCETMLQKLHPDWTMASWALRFVRSLPGVQTVLSGMSDMDQIIDNVKTFNDDEEFTEADKEALIKACELFKKQLTIPCTGCRYCVDNCPMGINIPEYLKVLNDVKVNGPWGARRANDIESDGLPANCIGCGACRAQCPQSLNIPFYMEEMAGYMK